MKNFINYYYKMNIQDIFLQNEKYTFMNGKTIYIFKPCNDISKLDNYSHLEYQLINYHFFSLVIPNRDGNYITWIDGKSYVLLRVGNIKNDRMSIYDIKSNMYVKADNKLNNLVHFPWITLWENKIDYYENWFNEKQDSYKKLYCLFNYFIGIAENALLYLKETEREAIKTNLDRLVISHDRLNVRYDLYGYYDSTNIIIDHPSRDISEYVKSMFINKEYNYEILKDYLKNNNFSNYGLRLILARICFPSFFFDYLEKTILNNNDTDLLYLENRAEEFYLFIKDMNNLLGKEYRIPTISWIIKGT